MSVVIDGTLGITSPAETVQGALTTTGNTILGDASTDTLNVGNGGLVKDASGNVGIGITPSAWVSGDTVVQVKSGAGTSSFWSRNGSMRTITNGYYDGTNYRYTASSLGVSIYECSAGNHAWTTAASGTAGNTFTPTERMSIDSSGNVWIATGNLTLSGASGVAKATYINSQALSAGSVSASANGTLINTSDATLKISDGYLENGLNKLTELQSRYFYFKDTEGNADYAEGRQLGFFAQEVQIAIGDEASPTPPEGKHYSIHDRALIAVCVKAIQELKAIVDAQAVRIAALES
jgi:hypothetical protein